MKRAVTAFFTLLVLCLFAGCSLAEPSGELEQIVDENDQWWLPEYLKEASGIAVMEDQSILVHDDEFAVIYRISLDEGSIETFGWLGSPDFERDFEGIALDGETLYIVTSEGFIYYTTVNLHEQSQTLDFAVIDTGLSSICELEGLLFLSGKLLLPCKVPKHDFYKNKFAIFEFDVKTRKIGEHLVLPASSFGAVEGPYPSAIEFAENHYFIVTTNYLIKIDAETLVTSVYSLPKSRHFQPEGIGLLEDGSLILVEDVRKKGRSRLTHYPGIEFLEQIH